MSRKRLFKLILTTEDSNRAIAASTNCSHNTVARYRDRLAEEGLTWEAVHVMPESTLMSRLNNGRELIKKRFAEPDWAIVHNEMHRVGVTLTLLYEEYAGGVDTGCMSEREFRRRYDSYCRRLGTSMRQVRRPGEDLFVDYSGKRPSITDRQTGLKTPVEMWVGALGTSRKTFVYCTHSQQLHDWIEAHQKAIEFYGALPLYFVPDNLKSAVVSVSRKNGHYINPTYQSFADHYDVLVMPTRSRRPRDKAAVESAVRLAQMWILARLRNRTFFSIEQLNSAILELVLAMNDKPMRTRGGKSRNTLFEEMDLPMMRASPISTYEYAEWKLNLCVPKDYHVVFESNYYSVPHHLVTEKVNVRATSTVVEAYYRDRLVATHARSFGTSEIFTKKEHQPPGHRSYGEEQASDMVGWAESVGTSAAGFVRLHQERNSPGASLQACKGLRRLVRELGPERVEHACARALKMKAITMSSIRSMLQRGIENTPLRGEATNEPIPAHDNIRGAATYQ